ncbi:MAG: hypothetical protein HQL10_04875 [Nitrospirae bacterium]|nr:hypothetical protein [Nitrospirota bacterium]
MKLLVAVSSPGPAESLSLLVKELRRRGIETDLINVSNDNGGTLRSDIVYQGARSILKSSGVDFKEADSFGPLPDYYNVSVEFAAGLLDRLQPDKVLVGTYRDLTMERVTLEDALIVAARMARIPVFQFVDMWDNWFQKKKLSIEPDAFLVQDGITERLIRKRGGGSGTYNIVGNPSLEWFIRTRTTRQKRLSKELFGLEGRRVIAYFGQCAPVNNEISLGWAMEALGASDVLIFCKHPRDERELAMRYRNDSRMIELPVSSDDILDVTDICLTHTSTMSIKASFLKIKTINIIPAGECDELLSECGGYPLSLMGGSILVRSSGELHEALASETFHSINFASFVEETNTGHAIEKMTGLLRTLSHNA